MTTTFQIPRVLQQHAGGKAELSVPGSTVRAVLGAIRRDHPSLYTCICDETGRLRRHLNLFVNNQLVRGEDALDMRLAQGDVVSLFQAVSGG